MIQSEAQAGELFIAIPPVPAAVAQDLALEDRLLDELPLTSGEPEGRASPRKAADGCMLLGIGAGGFAVLALILFGTLWFSGRIPALPVMDGPAAESESIVTAEEPGTVSSLLPLEEEVNTPSAVTQTTGEPPAASPTSGPAVPTLTLPPPTPTLSVIVYDIRIVIERRDSFVVVNESAMPFPLRVLRISNDRASVDPEDWPNDFLESGECVAVQKDKGKPRLPRGYRCETYEVIERPSKFWEEAFRIQVDDQLLPERCESGECVYQVEIQP